MKYDAEFGNGRSIQKCAQNAGLNVLKTCLLTDVHLNFLSLCLFPNLCITYIFWNVWYKFCTEPQKRKSLVIFILHLLSKDS